MDKFDRIFQLHTVLSSRKTAIPLEDLMARLECSKSTLHRCINALKEHLNAPVIFDTEAGGYRYVDSESTLFELPGLWFTPQELQALAVLQRLLSDMGQGLLQEHLEPVAKRLTQLTHHRHLNLSEATNRLRFPAAAARPVGPAFQVAVSATLQRKKLWIEYHARTTDRRGDRTVSPQRVTRYRESWYLDAWDEDKHALRCFSIDRIVKLTLLEEPARDIPDAELDSHYASAYGIFGGKADKTAVLKFSGERVRWVSDEIWHPQQVGSHLPDGSYELRVPYNDPRELVMDILRQGPNVVVLEPYSLKEEVRGQLSRALTSMLRRLQPLSHKIVEAHVQQFCRKEIRPRDALAPSRSYGGRASRSLWGRTLFLGVKF